MTDPSILLIAHGILSPNETPRTHPTTSPSLLYPNTAHPHSLTNCQLFGVLYNYFYQIFCATVAGFVKSFNITTLHYDESSKQQMNELLNYCSSCSSLIRISFSMAMETTQL